MSSADVTALRRYAGLFDGTWRLDPDWSTLEIMMLDVSMAQIFVRMLITSGALGQPAPSCRTPEIDRPAQSTMTPGVKNSRISLTFRGATCPTPPSTG
jgi:hypothetical protein